MDDRGDHNKWIVILQEFDLGFVLEKLNISLGFVELMTYLPSIGEDMIYEDSFMDEHFFLISSTKPWYGNIICYLQTLKAALNILKDEHRCLCHNSKNSLIIDKTMYLHGVESILHHFFTHDEVEVVLNDFHGGLCGGQLSRIATRIIFRG